MFQLETEKKLLGGNSLGAAVVYTWIATCRCL